MLLMMMLKLMLESSSSLSQGLMLMYRLNGVITTRFDEHLLAWIGIWQCA